jgi:hypothetical protein
MTVNQIKDHLLDLYQEKILLVDAYRTGAMYDSIEIIVKVNQTGPTVWVQGIEYLPYVDEGTRYITARDITEKWMADPKFDELYEELTALWIEGELEF